MEISSCRGELFACHFFYLNGVLVAKWVLGSCTWMQTNFTCAHKLKLKDFLTNYLFQFEVYIWYATWRYNIKKYLEKNKDFFFFLDPSKVLDKSRARKMIIFFPIILRSQFSIRTLMFSFQNSTTPMLGTLFLLMICHINIYLMIRVVLYFWNCLRVQVAMGITCSPPFFLTWYCFIRLGLMFKLTWNIILLGLLEAQVGAILIIICYFKIIVIIVMQYAIQKQKWKKCNIFIIILSISI